MACLQLHAGLPPVALDRVRMEQVIVNLVSNAVQAPPEGGTLTVHTSVADITARPPREAARVMLEIADTGGGIAPEHQSRLFDPFFTTKPVGQGTGLGLAIVRSIVRIHGGSVSLGQPARRWRCARNR